MTSIAGFTLADLMEDDGDAVPGVSAPVSQVVASGTSILAAMSGVPRPASGAEVTGKKRKPSAKKSKKGSDSNSDEKESKPKKAKKASKDGEDKVKKAAKKKQKDKEQDSGPDSEAKGKKNAKGGKDDKAQKEAAKAKKKDAKAKGKSKGRKKTTTSDAVGAGRVVDLGSSDDDDDGVENSTEDVREQAEEIVVDLLDKNGIHPPRKYVDSDDEESSDEEEEEDTGDYDGAGGRRSRRISARATASKKQTLPLLGTSVLVESSNNKVYDNCIALQKYVQQGEGYKELVKALKRDDGKEIANMFSEDTCRNFTQQGAALFKALYKRGEKEGIVAFVKRVCKDMPVWDAYASKHTRCWPWLKIRCKEIPVLEAIYEAQDKAVKDMWNKLQKLKDKPEEKAALAHHHKVGKMVRMHLEDYVERVTREAEQWMLVTQQRMWGMVYEAAAEGVNAVDCSGVPKWEHLSLDVQAEIADELVKVFGEEDEAPEWVEELLVQTDEMHRQVDILLGFEADDSDDESEKTKERRSRRDPEVVFDTELSDSDSEDGEFCVSEPEEEEGEVSEVEEESDEGYYDSD